jgi:hypothetical protein
VAGVTLSDAESDILSRWNLRRFKEGKLLSEAMIIG